MIWNKFKTKITGKTLEYLSNNLPINKPINMSVTVTAEIHSPRKYTFDSAIPRDRKYSHNVGKITAANKIKIFSSI